MNNNLMVCATYKFLLLLLFFSLSKKKNEMWPISDTDNLANVMGIAESSKCDTQSMTENNDK